jgi:hypothetical protein
MPHIIADIVQSHRGCKLEAVNQPRRRVLDVAPFSLVLLLCGLTLNHPLAATSLFDPERGALEHADLNQSLANSGSSLHGLRLDGVLTLGDHRRVVISGSKGETYRFNWQGVIEKPMAFKGESADRMAGFKLSSMDTRSVWLQLPSGIGCEPDPERGIAACEEGLAKLAMVRRSAPPASPPTTTVNAGRNSVQRGNSPAPAGNRQKQYTPPQTVHQTQGRGTELQISRIQMQEEQQRVINSAPLGYFGYVNPGAEQGTSGNSAQQGTSGDSTQQGTSGVSVQQGTSGNSAQQGNSPASTNNPQQQNSQPQPTEIVESPERARMREEQQRLIDSAPPGWWGVE